MIHKDGTTDESLLHCYMSAFENALNAQAVFSFEKIMDANTAMANLTAYAKHQLSGLDIAAICPDVSSYLQSKKSSPWCSRSFVLTRDNKKIQVELTIYPLETKCSEPLFLCTIRDLSEVKKTRQQLKKSQERYLLMTEEIATGITRSIPGPAGRFIEVNKAAQDLLGYSKEEFFNTNIFRLHKTIFKAEAIYKAIQVHGVVRDKEIVLVHKDGSHVTVSYTGRAVRDDNGVIRYVDDMIADIQTRKLSEDDIQKSEQLQAIGNLAAGIAHNFNNIMTAVFGNISLAKAEIKKGKPTLKHLEKAEQAMQKGISLTRQLLTFAKGGEPVKEILDIIPVIKNAAEFTISGSNVQFDFHSPESPWPVSADRNQISQAVSNIVLNSIQAMEKGGKLTISIEKSTMLKDNLLTIARGRYLKITITDTGTGIAQKDIKKIFNPYFTTKRDSSGMGLSIGYSIIHKHNGHIFLSSQINQGTTITIYLPAAPPVKGKKAQTVSDPKASILVMDDEEHILILLQKILEKFGYHVQCVSDGKKAVEMYQKMAEQTAAPELVILDLSVPGGMGGKDAARKILDLDPDARIIISSGNANNLPMSDYKAMGLKGIIPKPYRLADLKEKIDEVLSN